MSHSLVLFLLFVPFFAHAWSPGADRLDELVPLTAGKKVGLVAHPASRLNDGTPTLDAMIAKGIQVRVVFAPDRSFRGKYEAGDPPLGARDEKTGIEIRKIPPAKKFPKGILKGIDTLVFDLQDAGARPFLYHSLLLSLLAESAHERLPFIVLDRPNPQGAAIDGPVPAAGLTVPLLHGMTMGELAKYLASERAFAQANQLSLTVLPVKGWSRGDAVELPVAPSANLKSERAVRLYPSLSLVDATVASVGRGTEKAFLWAGHPDFTRGLISFTPRSIPGISPAPLFEGVPCYGFDWSTVPMDELRSRKTLDLRPLLAFFEAERGESGLQGKYFEDFFDEVAGTPELRKQLLHGESEEKIRASWKAPLDKFIGRRKASLLYPE